MSMRAVMLGPYPLDERQVAGGPEAVMLALLDGLARLEDLEVHVVTCAPSLERASGSTVSGWQLHTVKRRRWGRVTFHARDRQAMVQAVDELAPDVVHAQGMGIYAGAALDSRLPHVVTVHGIFSREAAFAGGLLGRVRGKLDSAFEKRCVSRTSNMIVISPYVQEEIDRIGGFRGRVFPVENPVDRSFFGLDTVPQDGCVLFVGRVIPRKDLLSLLMAAERVRKQVPYLQVRVAGEFASAPDYYRLCRSFVHEHGLGDNVRFLGALSQSDILDEFGRCAVLALPSAQETAPVAVAEAMAAARPVVASRVCGLPYMVEDGQTGILVEPGRPDELAVAMMRLLQDPPTCDRMGRRGRDVALGRFWPDVIARQTRAVYQVVAAQTGSLLPSAGHRPQRTG
jgi:glycosyltransferase involved in cell wall biosynthesis